MLCEEQPTTGHISAGEKKKKRPIRLPARFNAEHRKRKNDSTPFDCIDTIDSRSVTKQSKHGEIIKNKQEEYHLNVVTYLVRA